MRKKILVADDQRLVTSVLGFNFSSAGYEIVTVGDGKAALQLARDLSPDLVVLDVVMPGMDGYEVCRCLKADPATRHIPVIILSSKVRRIDHDLGLEVGADDYVKKPVSVRRLVEAARFLLGDGGAMAEGRYAA